MSALFLATALILSTEPSSAPRVQLSAQGALMLSAVLADSGAAPSNIQKELRDAAEKGKAPKSRAELNASKISCRTSSVDITTIECVVTAGPKSKAFAVGGARAFSVLAALQLAGARGEGTAGSTYLTVTDVRCVISPEAFGAGGGATCDATAGAAP